jgi:hypothetical protein
MPLLSVWLGNLRHGLARTRLRNSLVLILLIWRVGAVPASGATFTASLDTDTITLGETATLSLSFEGVPAQNAPALPNIPNLQISYAGPSSQTTFINGQVSYSLTHVYRVVARQPGEFTIPAISTEVGGQKLTSTPLKLTVLKPGSPTPDAINSGTQLAFLKLVPPKKSMYLGETVVAELQLFISSKARGFGGFQLRPVPADGFTLGQIVEGERHRATVGNTMYTVISLLVPIRSVKTGPLELGPITAGITVEVPDTNRRRDPIFDLLGGMGGEQKQISLAADAEKIEVLPLPRENVPPGYNGAIGNFAMTFSATPTNVGVGDPITVKVQITGRGTLDSLNVPEQPAWSTFKIYPPTQKLDTTDKFGLEGTKSFEQVLVPQSADIKELPALSFSYFDPDQKAYRTLSQAPIPLLVHPGGTVPTPVIAAGYGAKENTPPVQDIVHIKQRLGTLAQASPPLIQQTWFLAMQGIPVVAWVATFIWRRRSDALAANPRLLRQRRVAAIMQEGLVQLRSLAGQRKADEFFAALFHLLQEQIGERLDLPSSSITEAVIEEHLRPRGLAEPLLTSLHELFQTCNLARYAAMQSAEELAANIPKLENVCRELRECKL